MPALTEHRYVQFRPGELREPIETRMGPGWAWGRVAKRDLERYYWLLEQERSLLLEDISHNDMAVLDRVIPDRVEGDLSFLLGLPEMVRRGGGSNRLTDVLNILSLAGRTAVLDLVEQERARAG